MVNSLLQRYADPADDPQVPFDVAVVMPTTLRPTIGDALDSVFHQDLPGRIQILVGVDKPVGAIEQLDSICARRPKNCTVQLFYPGYSTSERHGGLHPAHDGGVLRCVLSYLANSRYVAYLDDDNWWAPNHLSSLLTAIKGVDWAYSFRWYVNPETRQPICVDQWESVGPGKGAYADYPGIKGWVDPNSLLVDKLACEPALRHWTTPVPGRPSSTNADCMVFMHLRANHGFRATHEATTFYQMNPKDSGHTLRVKLIAAAFQAAGEAALPPGELPRKTLSLADRVHTSIVSGTAIQFSPNRPRK